MSESTKIFHNLIENFYSQRQENLENLEAFVQENSNLDYHDNTSQPQSLINSSDISSARRFIKIINEYYDHHFSASAKKIFQIISSQLSNHSDESSILISNHSNETDIITVSSSFVLVLQKLMQELFNNLSPHGRIHFNASNLGVESMFVIHVHGLLKIKLNVLDELNIDSLLLNPHDNSVTYIYLFFIILFIEENKGKIIFSKVSLQNYIITIMFPNLEKYN